MAADLIQFVDSIASAPTVRLNLNDNSPWRCPKFIHTPAQLRRAEGQNAMTNGGFVSSSAYGWSRVALTLDLSGTQDAQATQIQLLARELDRADNFLKYQPNGLTKPVFFVVKRSNMTDVEDRESRNPRRQIAVDLLCESHALGLRETLGPFTVNNDPAAGSNGLYFDVTGVIGDVTAPAMLVDSASWCPAFYLSTRQHGTPSDMTFFKQAESCTLGTDTTNPGGGPDAAMSGTGTNNFVRTSFATDSSMAIRLTWVVPGGETSNAAGLAMNGTYRVLAVVRRSDSTSVMKAQLYGSSTVTTIPLATERQVIDLGPWAPAGTVAGRPGGYAAEVGPTAKAVLVQASRSSGSGTLDWDFLMLLPADESCMVVKYADSRATDKDTIVDSFNEEVRRLDGGDAFDGTGWFGQTVPTSGGFPQLVPGRTNRLYMVVGDAPAGVFTTTKSTSETISVHYWPHYLHVRPSAT